MQSFRKFMLVAMTGGAVVASFGLRQSQAHATELKVVATIRPIHSIAASVMEGVGEPRLLIDGVGSPHTFTLKPSDAKALHEASLVIRVSESLEPFTARIARALPESVRVVTLEGVPGLVLHKLRTGATFEAHDDGLKPGTKTAHAHGHAHRHGSAASTSGAAPAGNDGHIWLDPGNAKLIAAHIAEVLAEAAPQHGGRFRDNARALAAKLDALSDEMGVRLAPLAGKPYVVFHDAYQYLERRYGLAPVGSVTVSPEVPPSAKRIAQLRRKVSSLKAACIFAEPQFEPKLIDTIIEGTPARRGTLDPLGVGIPAGPDQYVRLLQALADDLAGCLGKPI